MSPQEMVPTIWFELTVYGLAFSLLSHASHHEAPDAILSEAYSKAWAAITMATQPQLIYASTELGDWDISALPRKMILASLGKMMHVAEHITMLLDRTTVDRRTTTAHPVIPHEADLTSLFREAEMKSSEVRPCSQVADMHTIAYADLPTISVNRITGGDVKPKLAPPPPDWRGQ